LQQQQLQAVFSVFDVVKMLRKHRQAMVQTSEQYLFVFKAILDLVRQILDSLLAGDVSGPPARPVKPTASTTAAVASSTTLTTEHTPSISRAF
jgi:hypothetical protein